MNEQQSDELLALSAIFEDVVTYTVSETSVEVMLSIPVDFGEEKEFQVWNLATQEPEQDAPPPPPAPSSSSVSATPLQAAVPVPPPHYALTNSSPPASSSNNKNRRRRNRGSKRGGGSPSSPPTPHVIPLVPATTPAPPSRTSVVLTLNLPSKTPSSSASSPPIAPVIVRRPSTPPPAIAPPVEAASTEPTAEVLRLRYLPPVKLRVVLGPGYPNESGFDELEVIECGWLEKGWKEMLEDRLKESWTGDECLSLVVDAIQDTDQLVATLDISFPAVLHQTESSPIPLSTTLLNHSRSHAKSLFNNTTFSCALCLTTHLGTTCHSLRSCGCTFCLPCLRGYFGMLISEGGRGLKCPAMGCMERRRKAGAVVQEGEEEQEIGDDEMEEIVGKESVERWQRLREKTRLESDPSVTFCPRKTCGVAVPRPQTEERDERLRICPTCDYPFCVYCSRVYHGPRTPCALPQTSAIVSSYLSGTVEQKNALEQRYGKQNIRRLVTAYEEERLSKEWIDGKTATCPGCSAGVEKSEGCNHMQCSQCSSHFCFRCSCSLSPSDPYKHFSTAGSRCYNKLFDFNPGAEPPVEEWLGRILAEDEAEAGGGEAAYHVGGWNPFA